MPCLQGIKHQIGADDVVLVLPYSRACRTEQPPPVRGRCTPASCWEQQQHRSGHRQEQRTLPRGQLFEQDRASPPVQDRLGSD